MEQQLHLPAEAAALHVQRKTARSSHHTKSDYRRAGRDFEKPAGTQRETTRLAKRSVGIRGRSIFGMLLGAFIIVTLTVVWRRSIGFPEARDIQQLPRSKSDLEGERARLESELRDLTSRQRLGP